MISLKCVCLLGTTGSLSNSFTIKEHRNNVLKWTLLNYHHLCSWYYRTKVYFVIGSSLSVILLVPELYLWTMTGRQMLQLLLPLILVCTALVYDPITLSFLVDSYLPCIIWYLPHLQIHRVQTTMTHMHIN